MNSKTLWVVVAVIGLIILLFLLPLLAGRILPGGYGGMMGQGMMGGYGFFNPIGWLGMGLMFLFPLGIIVLVVLGVVFLVNGLNRSGQQGPGSSITTNACRNCGKAVQSDWKTCPYCGTAL